MNACWKALCILLCTAVVGIRGDLAPAGQAAPTSTWAIVSSRELQSTGLPDLVFLRLAALEEIELVERDAYQAVLDESELVAMSGAGAVGKRIQIGQRVAADVLMILDMVRARSFDWDTQYAEGKRGVARDLPSRERRYVRVVFCDARSGARLSTQSVDLEDRSATDVAGEIQACAKIAQKKFAGGLRYVIGVSPFVSQDLTHEYDIYQESLSGLTESVFMAMPRVAVIEQEEAEVLWSEIADKEDSNPRRAVPILVTGQFKVDRPRDGKSPHFTLHMLGRFSDGTTREATARAVPIEELPKCVARLARRLLQELPRIADSSIEPVAQFQWLTRQANLFSRIGTWKPALGLRRAALLIAPEDVPMRMQLIGDERMLLREMSLSRNQQKGWPGPVGSLGRAERLIAIYNDQLQNEEFLIRNRRIDKDRALRLFLGRGYLRSQSGVRKTEIQKNPKVRALLSETEQRRKQYLLKIASSLFRLPDSEKSSEGVQKAGRMADLQSVLLLQILDRIDYQTPTLSDLDFLRKLWIHEIPDTLGFPGVLRWACRQFFPEVEKFENKLRYHHLIYKQQSLTPEQWAHFLEGLSHVDHRTARISASRELLLWKWYWVDQNTSADSIASISDMANSIAAEIGDYPVRSNRGRFYLESGGGDLRPLLEKIKWQIHRLSVMPDPYGPRRKLDVAPARPRPRLASGVKREPPPLRFRWEKLEFHLDLPITDDALPRNVQPSILQSSRFCNGKCCEPATLHWLACGDRLDVAWMPFALHFMRAPGKLERLRFPVAHDVVIDDVRWDGRQLWVATLASGIWVFDADLRVSRHISARDGLPPSEHAIRVLPIEGGRACAAGSLGPHFRGWCAMIDFPEGKTRVDVFHEAKKVDTGRGIGKATRNDRENDIHRTFVPFLLMRLPETAVPNGGHHEWLCVGRAIGGASQAGSPLLIDPQDLSVTTASELGAYHDNLKPRLLREDQFFHFGGRLYPITEYKQLFRTVAHKNRPLFPDYRRMGRGQGYLRLGNRIVVPTFPYWHALDLQTGDLEDLRIAKPRFFFETPTFARSAHYGIVAWGLNGRQFMKVEIEDPPARQASERSVPTNRGKEGQTPAKPDHAFNTLRMDLAVIPTDQKIEHIRQRIRELWDRGHTLPPDAPVYYTRGIAMFDGWLSAVGAWSMYLDPPIKQEGYAFHIHRGRVVRVVSLDRKGSNMKIWYNAAGAPQLSVSEFIDRKTGRYIPIRYRWGIYEDRGMLGKIIHFDRHLALDRIVVLKHADNYQYVVKTKYSGTGKPGRQEVVKYPLDAEGRPILPGQDRAIAYSFRLEEIKTPTRIGLKPYYPLPSVPQ